MAQTETPLYIREVKQQLEELEVSINEYKRWVPELQIHNDYIE